MLQVRSNIAAIVTTHLVRARDHYERGIECHRQAADEIVTAMELDPSLSLRKIGEALSVHHTTVSRLLKWRKGGADRTTTPFGGDPDRLRRAVRQALHERPELVISEAVATPDAMRRFFAEHSDVADQFDREVRSSQTAASASEDSDEEAASPGNPIIRAWQNANAKQRREFILELDKLIS